MKRFPGFINGLCLAGAMIAISIAGCGAGNDGPPRYPLSGTVTFEGQPVPIGTIYFNPDGTQGNTGPGSAADIRDGKYETPAGKGHVGGPMIIRVDGYDGIEVQENGETLTQGKSMFPTFETKADLPKEKAEKNFVVEKPII